MIMSLYNQCNHECEIFLILICLQTINYKQSTLHDKLKQWLLIVFFGKRKKYTVLVTGNTIDDKKPQTNY